MNVWHFPKGILRWIRNGKLQIWVHSTRRDLSFISVLTTIGLIQYCRHKSHFKIHFSHRAAVSYYYSLIYYCWDQLILSRPLCVSPFWPHTSVCLGPFCPKAYSLGRPGQIIRYSRAPWGLHMGFPYLKTEVPCTTLFYLTVPQSPRRPAMIPPMAAGEERATPMFPPSPWLSDLEGPYVGYGGMCVSYFSMQASPLLS